MGLVGDIAGAFIGAKSAKKASKAQSKAAEAAIAEQRRQYDLSRADMAPWQVAGSAAIGSLSEMLKPGYDHTTSPGYQFRLDEGLRGVENSAAAKGLLQSGGTLKGIDKYAEGLAASDFNDQFNRTASVAAGGQQVNNTLGQLGANSANSIGDLLTQQGNAKASGYMGAANSWINGINNFDSRIQQAASMFSERELKTDIEALGYEIGGVPAHSFHYRQDADVVLPEGQFVGVMADDVARLRPDALGPIVSGYRTVDYGALAR